MMSHWNGTIIGPGHVSSFSLTDRPPSPCSHAFIPQTVHENRIYSLSVHCDDQYPEVAPAVTFISRVNLPFVDQKNGKVDLKKIQNLSHWSHDMSLETILVEIRR